MEKKVSRAIKNKSEITYDYSTVRITRSRIEKGLIAIPLSLYKWFPRYNTTIKVFIDDSSVFHNKHYSSYTSSTRECRIGGMLGWFKENKIKDGSEVVVQLVDKEKYIYRLIPEHRFIHKTQELQKNLDNSKDEIEASDTIYNLSRWTDLDKAKVTLREYRRIVDNMPIEERRYISKRSRQARENVPPSLRVLLGDIYRGHCQVCNFWFMKKNGEPYFETHHIDTSKANHPKNLILVCANCHRQFEYSNVIHKFDKQNWLIRVSFNKKIYIVNQVFLRQKWEEPIKELFV